MSLEQLLLFAVLLLVPLLNFVRRRMRTALESQARRTPDPERPAASPRVDAPTTGVARAPRAAQPARRLAPPPARAGRRPRVTVRGRSEARRGIVLLTILGPCRALEDS